MPHYDAIIDTSSPPILESCGGDPERVREAIMAEAPAGANVRSLSFVSGKDQVRITVEGPGAEDYLRTLEARDIVELVTTGERKNQRASS
jgi:sarcosine oxidase gamma subunit